MRLPAFTAGVLLVPAVYWLAKRLYDRWTALGAALLVAWWPTLINYSTNARGYTLVALFTLLTLTLRQHSSRGKKPFCMGVDRLVLCAGSLYDPRDAISFRDAVCLAFIEQSGRRTWTIPIQKGFSKVLGGSRPRSRGIDNDTIHTHTDLYGLAKSFRERVRRPTSMARSIANSLPTVRRNMGRMDKRVPVLAVSSLPQAGSLAWCSTDGFPLRSSRCNWQSYCGVLP